MSNFKRTTQSQSMRKTQGTKYEYMVANDLRKRKLPKIRIYTKEGVDIHASNGIKWKVEVKSLKMYENIGNGKKRMGRITLKKKDLEDSDIVAMVIRDTHEIIYVKSNKIKKWLKDKGKYQTGKSTKITIKQMKNFPRARLH